MRIAGLTDYQIAARTFEMLGVDADDGVAAAHGRPVRGAAARRACRARQGRVLPNVREILEHLRGRADVRSYLLTGNTRGGRAGEADALRPVRTSFPTARSPRTRASGRRSPRRALELARRGGAGRRRPACSSSATRRTTSSAPTPSARGRSPWRPAATRVEELRGARPWRVFDELPPPDEFVRLIDEPRRATGRRAQPRSHEARHSPASRALARDAAGCGAGITPGSTPIPTGGRRSRPSRRCGSRRGSAAQGGPRVLMATRDRLLRARGHARERARRGADVPRRRGARAALRRRADRVRRVRGVALSRTSRRSSRTGRARDLCRDCPWPAERVYAAARAEGPSLQRLADAGGPRRGARASPPTMPRRRHPGLHAATAWPSASTPRRRAAVLRHRLARRRAARRGRCCAATSSRRC